ncbi:MAG TPA: hypothetical protein VL651_06065 [Bacteroidia bacterium]|jgi:hypothetical protein|nr:hypothetical protein [Bacteroidia bacterium]
MFTGDESSTITITDATNWTANFRNANPGQIKAHFFGKNKLLTILNQTGCLGIRFYNGIDDQGVRVLIAVGATSSENDQYKQTILDRAIACPNNCDTGGSPLNA